MGLCRAPAYGLSIPATMDLFGHYGSDIVAVIILLPFGIGVLISAPISGKTCVNIELVDLGQVNCLIFIWLSD